MTSLSEILRAGRLARTAVIAAIPTLMLGAALAADETEPTPAETPQTAPAVTIGNGALKINGFISASYEYNSNDPDSGTNQLRVFDGDANEFKLDVAELVLQVPVADRGDIGFRVDFTFGQHIPKVAASYGLFRDEDTGEAKNYDIQQAYGSWNAPLGKGLRLDLGKFVTHAGAELIDGYDGYNDNYTRSILFGYAIPFAHTGLKASYSFTDKFSGMVMMAQGWDNFKDNNGGKTIGAQLTFAPSKKFTFYTNYLSGPEQTDNDDNNRTLLDFIGVWKATDKFTAMFNYDTASEDNAVETGNAKWSGYALYGRYNITDKFALSARAESFKDADGARTGLPQTVKEYTITPEYRFTQKFILRGDLRRDSSNQPFFEKNGGEFSDSQTTMAVNAIYVF